MRDAIQKADWITRPAAAPIDELSTAPPSWGYLN